jgi:hypothetical protein
MTALNRLLGQRLWPRRRTLTRRRLTLGAGGRLLECHILSNPLMPNVPNLYAPWTYDELLITMPAQHTPVARPTSLLAGNDVKLERTKLRSVRPEQRDHPYRIDLLRVSYPLGTIVPERAIGPGARMGVVHAQRRCTGRSSSARDDREVI